MGPDSERSTPAASSAAGAGDPRRALLERALGNQYEIVRLLGKGGAGAVYLARERLLERLVAIKVLNSEYVNADARERFVREARTAAKLMHPHIVPLYAFGEAGDTLYYIMGYVEGESLESMIARLGRCDTTEARRILVEVADALAYAHRLGVVHRDVKPDNILIERESRRAILTDFGIAKVAAMQSTLTQTGVIVGTPLYMSPEQAAGDSAVDGRSDLYSLGVIGYRMLAGRLPIEGTSAQDVMRRHVMHDPTPLGEVAPDAPSDLSWAVTRCLDKEPSARWPTAEAFRQALESGEDSPTELPEPMEHLAGRAARAALAAWTAVVAATLLFAASGELRSLAVALLAVLPGVLIAVSLRTARRFGMSGIAAWRLLAAPPERWAGWWPLELRRRGDVWQQLPIEVRRARGARMLAVAAVFGAVLPASVAVAIAGHPTVAAAILVASVAVLGMLLAATRAAARSMLAAKGVQGRVVRKWLSEPTWGSPFWRRSEVTAHLAEASAPKKSAIDTAIEDPYCIITPTQIEIPHGMFDHIDPRSPTPLYAQIAARLRVAIASGELNPGDGLPSVRQLAGRLRINPATVVQAYRELEVDGLVATRQGAGSVVQDVASDRKSKEREQEARRLVREMLANAGSLGISAADLRVAMERELKSGNNR